MKLENTLTIPGTPDTVFALLIDLEQVAPCMPGATLTGRDGDAYEGRVAIRLGPLSMTYDGTLRFLDVDREARVATIKATGKEAKGQGSAEAYITATVTAVGDDSRLTIETDLQIRGKAAQLGRGALVEVSQRIMRSFADNVAGLLEGGPAASGPRGSAADASRIEQPAAVPAELEMGKVILRLAAERIGPALLLALVIWWVLGRRRSRRRSSSPSRS